MEKALVLHALPWSFKDEEGTQRDGIKVTYTQLDTVNGNDGKGLVIMNATLPAECAAEMQQIPGWYDLNMRMRPGAKGKAVLKLVGMTFTNRFEIPKEPVGSDVPRLEKVG